jgi:hypothetical protein
VSLHEQIFTIIISILYGNLSYFVFKKTKKSIYKSKKIYAFFNSLLFTLNLAIIYFIIIYYINDGIINILLIFLVLISFLSYSYFDLQKKCKNMTN